MNYAIILLPGPNNWGAFSPNVPGCVSVGATAEETLSNFQEALAAHLELMQEDGEPLPAEYDCDAEDVDYDSDYVYFRWAPVNTTPRDPAINPALPPLYPLPEDMDEAAIAAEEVAATVIPA